MSNILYLLATRDAKDITAIILSHFARLELITQLEIAICDLDAWTVKVKSSMPLLLYL
jgi:hypothetical protein